MLVFRNNKVCTLTKEFVHKWLWDNKVCTQFKNLFLSEIFRLLSNHLKVLSSSTMLD